MGGWFDPKIGNERIRTQGLGFKLPRIYKQLFSLSRLAAPANSSAYLSPFSGEVYEGL